MAAGPFRLSVIIGATTTEAVSALHGLEVRLNRISSQGGLRGGLAGGLSTGIAGLRTGVSALGGALSMVTMAFPALGTVARVAFSAIMTPLKWVTHAIGTGLSLAVGVGKAALMGLGGAAGLAVAGVYAAVKALGPAAFREKSLVSWEVMLGSKSKATERLGFLSKFEAETPFDFREVDQGARLMQSFGIYSARTLRAVGDAVSAFGKRIEDAVGPLAKLKNGLFESESLGTIGITRKSLEKEGVQFNRQGTMLTPGPQAFEAAVRSLEKRFGGMMDKVSRTWDGLMSTLGSSWDNLWATLGKNALGPAKRVLSEIIRGIDDMSGRLKDFTIPGLDHAVAAARMLRTLIGDLFTEEGRAELWGKRTVPATEGRPEQPGTGLLGTIEKIPGFLSTAFAAGVTALGVVIGELVKNLIPIGKLLAETLVGAGRVFCSLLSVVWTSMGAEMQDRIGLAFEQSGGWFLGVFQDLVNGLGSVLNGTLGKVFGFKLPELKLPGTSGYYTARMGVAEQHGVNAVEAAVSQSRNPRERSLSQDFRIAREEDRTVATREQLDTLLKKALGKGIITPMRRAELLDLQTETFRKNLGYKETGLGSYRDESRGMYGSMDSIAGQMKEVGIALTDAAKQAASEFAATVKGSLRETVAPVMAPLETRWRTARDATTDEARVAAIMEKRQYEAAAPSRIAEQLKTFFGPLDVKDRSLRTSARPRRRPGNAALPSGPEAEQEFGAPRTCRLQDPQDPPGVPASAGPAPLGRGTPDISLSDGLAAPLGGIAGNRDKLSRREQEAQSIRQDPERWLQGEGVGERDRQRWLDLGKDRLADVFQQTGKRGAALFAAAGGKRFGFRLPENIGSLLAMSPRERDRQRRDERGDARLTGKLGLLETGKPVAFTPAEKRRLADAGAVIPKPAWAIEQERLRPSMPMQEAPERLRPSMPVSRLDLEDNRIGNLGTDLEGRRGAIQEQRVDLKSDDKQTTLFNALLREIHRFNDHESEKAQALERLCRMTGVA